MSSPQPFNEAGIDEARANALIDKNIISHTPPKDALAVEKTMEEARASASKQNENEMLKAVLEKSMPAIADEIKNRASALSKQEFETEKAAMKKENELLLGEIAKLKDEFSALKEILLRAKAQGKATIPTEQDSKDAEFRAIFGDIVR